MSPGFHIKLVNVKTAINTNNSHKYKCNRCLRSFTFKSGFDKMLYLEESIKFILLVILKIMYVLYRCSS